MFSPFLVLALFTTGPDQGSVSWADLHRGGGEPRGYQQINADIRQLFRREVQAETESERATAVVAMTRLYQEVRRDPRLANSPTLKGYKARLWGRLQRVKKEIEKQIAHDRRRGGPGSNASGDGSAYSPANARPHTGAYGGRAIPDWGPGLVALIERTIAPEFWDVHGGPGTIVYYRPLHVIVVRATSEVHHQIGGTLGALREAGR